MRGASAHTAGVIFVRANGPPVLGGFRLSKRNSRRSSRPGALLDQLWFVPVHVILPSPVVQIGPVGGPPRRSADKTPNPPPAVRTKNLQVASSTRGREARNKPVVQVLVLLLPAVKRVRNSRLYIWRSPLPANDHASSRSSVPQVYQRRG